MIKDILSRYDYKKITPEDWKERTEATKDYYNYLKTKWASKVGKNWYGFDLEGVPLSWMQIINDFLTEIFEQTHPDEETFEIHQIKLKFGGIRFYVECADRFKEDIQILEKELNNNKLVW